MYSKSAISDDLKVGHNKHARRKGILENKTLFLKDQREERKM